MLSRQPVTTILNGRLAPSLSLIVGVTLLATLVGVAIGTFGARRGRIGRAIDGGSIVGLAVPDFWFGLMLIVVFAVNLALVSTDRLRAVGRRGRRLAQVDHPAGHHARRSGNGSDRQADPRRDVDRARRRVRPHLARRRCR